MNLPNPCRGRPTTYDEEIAREVIWEIAHGMSATAAATDRGIPSTTWARWKQRVPGLADRIEAAEVERWDRRLTRLAAEKEKRRCIAAFKRDRRVRLRREQKRADWESNCRKFGGNLELMQSLGVKLPKEAKQRLRFDRFLEMKAAGCYRDADRHSPWRRGERARRTEADWMALSEP
jgi:hypothetical protein